MTETAKFLERHPFLVGLIDEARDKAQEYFPGSGFALELSNYSPELFGNIITDLSVDEALDRLWRMDEEWWLDQLNRTQGLFCIDVIPEGVDGEAE